jgi:hypothetical protein
MHIAKNRDKREELINSFYESRIFLFFYFLK